jgi:putative phage-type endonuclease
MTSDVEPSGAAPSVAGRAESVPALPDLSWHEWRRAGIGASDIAGLLGLSWWTSPTKLYYEKIGLLPPSDETQRQRIGKRLEGVIAAEFTDETGLFVTGEQTWCHNPDHRWMHATVDGFIFEGEAAMGPAPIGLFEAKSDGTVRWSQIPPYYAAQGQWQMAVTGLPKVWFAVLHSNFRFEVYELDRDDDDISFMIERARAFWFDNVLAQQPPEPDDSAATARAFAVLWPKSEPGKEVDVDSRLFARWEKRRDIRKRADARAKDARAKEDAVKHQIVEQVADAEVLLVDGQPVATYRTVERKGYTVEPSTYRTLREVKQKEQP